ncbi:glycerol kinase GlpK [Reinekea marinisedimentorum]|uniref:Glycerol kinase n=1 Tax=Reinekea marinisedimentorum TaxID=230495 RepID=A0A4R3I4F3_9GAMM|nr:glycerol kinase GlpK [Reinekea marinisedimentorum]TCS39963.1 glycerol kinase [Reinekea marinisedimentorum]
MSKYLLAIDQGTTSSRAILFDTKGNIVQSAQQEFPQIYPQNGWVEHDPEDLWSSTLEVCQQALKDIDVNEVIGLGVTNQRETTLVWDARTGKTVYNAIVWQDRRTADYCRGLQHDGLEAMVSYKTGLLLDPYFSGTKVRWILNNVDGAREAAEQGHLRFGTVDSYLLWRLTDGKRHATDATNASRTLLFNIQEQCWDNQLLNLFGIPESMLPEVLNSADDFGETAEHWFGKSLPIGGMAGDQHAAMFGQACFEPGMIKSTYGTGCFMMVNTGDEQLKSRNKLLSTVAYRLDGKPVFALEGSIFMAGATIQWLRDGAGFIEKASDSVALAEKTGKDQSVYMVPAFTGLGAPYWNADARGAIVGMTRDTGPAEIVTAGLQAIGYQTRDLVEAMKRDGVTNLKGLRVDGGMVVNEWAVQFLADILQVPVDRPMITETTALGVAFFAGLQLGVYKDIDEIRGIWTQEKEFAPSLSDETVERLYSGWLKAVKGVRTITE